MAVGAVRSGEKYIRPLSWKGTDKIAKKDIRLARDIRILHTNGVQVTRGAYYTWQFWCSALMGNAWNTDVDCCLFAIQ